MADLTTQQLAALTRLGAHARLAELVSEMDAILTAFPELGSEPARPAPKAPPAGKRRKHYKMSAENRKAAAERMKAYWAKKRAAKGQETAADRPARKARKTAKRRGRKARKS